jgi:DNA-binding NarL/FixJ family response regulator
MPRILIADDHGLYRKGLRSTLEAALPDLEVCEAPCFDSALSTIEADRGFDLVLIGLFMPGVLSIESLREAREAYTQTRFMIISASDVKEDVMGCLRAGFHGFVSKLQPDHEIVGAVQQVLAGAVYVPAWLAQLPIIESPRLGSVSAFRNQDPFLRLTPRQRDVLPLLAKGMSNKEIARALNITEATTKIHAAALCRALGVRNRIEAALAARNVLDNQTDAHPSHRT